MTGGPLSGFRVLDISHTLAGPLTGMHLADLGAYVIKLERPSGDEWREHEIVPGHPGRSRHHLQTNRGKRSIAVDLTHERGREIVHRLVERSDVLVTNLRPGVPERLGVDWPTCSALNERLVYCQISAFGDRGPRHNERGYALPIEALSGLVPRGGRTDDRPRPVSIPITDTASPFVALTGILAALLERERSGTGQRVELSLLGTAVALNAHSLVRLDDQPASVAAFASAFFRVYRTADDWIAIAAYADHLAHAACAAAGMPGLLDKQRFATKADRAARNDELTAILEARFERETTTHWLDALTAAGVPCGPIRERDALFDDEQVLATDLLTQVEDDELGTVTMMSPSVRLSRTPGAIRYPGRHLGADTRAVLGELGYASDVIAALETDGVVVSSG